MSVKRFSKQVFIEFAIISASAAKKQYSSPILLSSFYITTATLRKIIKI